jgi:Myb-like DNA-binding domain
MENQAKEKRKRGLWSSEEDAKLYNYISTFGVDSWSSLPRKAGNLSLSLKGCIFLPFFFFFFYLEINRASFNQKNKN